MEIKIDWGMLMYRPRALIWYLNFDRSSPEFGEKESFNPAKMENSGDAWAISGDRSWRKEASCRLRPLRRCSGDRNSPGNAAARTRTVTAAWTEMARRRKKGRRERKGEEEEEGEKKLAGDDGGDRVWWGEDAQGRETRRQGASREEGKCFLFFFCQKES